MADQNTGLIKKSKEAQERQVLDLREGNMPLYFTFTHLNGEKQQTDVFTGRFKTLKLAGDVRGLVLKSLILEKFVSISAFAKVIQKPKSWVFYLIHDSSKIKKVKPETNKKINDALGVEIIF